MITKRFSAALYLLCFVTFNGLVVCAQEAKLTALLQRSPAPANSMGYINLPALKKLMAEAEMPSELSDNLTEVWFISELDTIKLTPRWEAGYASMKKEVNAEMLAKGLNGYVDTVADKQVVWTPKQSYLIPIDAGRMGFIRPAKRTLLSDWLRSTGGGKAPTYLTEKATQSEQFLSLMIAIDLQDNFSPITLTSRLTTFESLKSMDIKSAANVLASVQGLSIIVGRRSLKECIISIDFAQSPASLLPVANALLNEILNRNGTAAPEVTMWQPKVDKNTLSFQGAITSESLESVLGIFSLSNFAGKVASSAQPPSQATQPPSQTTQPTSAGAYVQESKQYFSKVNAYVERVRKYSAQTTGYRAKWNDQQARHIDELGTLNVDPQLIEYGSTVSNLLRNNALTIRTGNITAGQIKATEGLSQASYGYAGYGEFSYYYDPNTSSDYQRVTDVQASGAAYSDYRTTLSKIDKLTEEYRKGMTTKYNVQF